MNEALIIGCAAIAAFAAAWRERAKARESESERDDWQRRAETFAERLRDLEPREARFRQALGYYADDATWLADNGGRSPAFRDRGRLAALALAKGAE